MKINKKNTNMEAETQIKLLNSKQAFETLGGNKRLFTFVNKKYPGNKALEEWRDTFVANNLI